MIKFLEYNIKDPNIIGLIKKYLKAGIMDKGQYVATEEGSAQGNIISPVLANVYMHFVLVLWYREVVQKRAKGDTFLVVYADDFIAGFQYKYEAEAYYEALKKRMSKFGLELDVDLQINSYTFSQIKKSAKLFVLHNIKLILKIFNTEFANSLCRCI